MQDLHRFAVTVREETVFFMAKELSQEAKDARREYMKRWRKNNPDKVKEYDRRRWEKLAQAKSDKDGDAGEC